MTPAVQQFRDRVLVLGAGIQGVCVALALAEQGYAVTVLDQADDCLLRASLVNEGKIHLGFVYANDPSLRTATLMLRAALHFAPLIDGWLKQPAPWDSLRSKPFVYGVMADSLLPTSSILAAYARIQTAYAELLDTGTNYLGARPAQLWQAAAPAAWMQYVASDAVTDRIATEEVAIDTRQFRLLLRNALHAAPAIETLYGHYVRAVQRTAAGFCVEVTDPAGRCAAWRRPMW